MTSSEQSQSSNAMNIPGYSAPVPEDDIITLADGGAETGAIDAVGQINWYQFLVRPSDTVTLTVEGSIGDYQISHFFKLLDKGDTAEPHAPLPESDDDVVTYTFSFTNLIMVYMSIQSADSASTPDSGYTVSLSVG